MRTPKHEAIIGRRPVPVSLRLNRQVTWQTQEFAKAQPERRTFAGILQTSVALLHIVDSMEIEPGSVIISNRSGYGALSYPNIKHRVQKDTETVLVSQDLPPKTLSALEQGADQRGISTSGMAEVSLRFGNFLLFHESQPLVIVGPTGQSAKTIIW